MSETIELQDQRASSVAVLQPFEDEPPPSHPLRRLLFFFRTSEGIALVCVVAYFFVGGIYYTQAQGFTLLNALYFSLGIVTTVGFQDASMAYSDPKGGKVFTAFFALVALVIVWVALLMLIRWFVRRREALFNQTVRKALHHFVSRRLKKNISHSLHHVPGLMRAWNYVRDSVLTQNALLVAALFILGVGVVSKTERTTFVSAFHWVASVATTTGIDNNTVRSEDGRIFALFWVIPMVASVAGLLTSVGQWILHTQYRDIEQFFAGLLTTELMKKFDNDGDEVITRDEWLIAALVAMGKVTSEEMHLIVAHFEEIDTNKDNRVQTSELEALKDWKHANTHGHRH